MVCLVLGKSIDQRTGSLWPSLGDKLVLSWSQQFGNQEQRIGQRQLHSSRNVRTRHTDEEAQSRGPIQPIPVRGRSAWTMPVPLEGACKLKG